MLGCQPSAPPPASTPTPTESAATPAQWNLRLFESGEPTEKVVVAGAKVTLPSGQEYQLSSSWPPPSTEGWESQKPVDGSYLAYTGEDGQDLFLPSDKDPELTRELQDLIPRAFAHEARYAWVGGRLEYKDLEGGIWSLVYAEEPDEDDPHGGKLVLSAPPPDGMKTDDLVVVFGSIAEQQMGIHMAGTTYEVREMSKLEK